MEKTQSQVDSKKEEDAEISLQRNGSGSSRDAHCRDYRIYNRIKNEQIHTQTKCRPVVIRPALCFLSQNLKTQKLTRQYSNFLFFISNFTPIYAFSRLLLQAKKMKK